MDLARLDQAIVEFNATNNSAANIILDAAVLLGHSYAASILVQRLVELAGWGFLSWPAVQWLASGAATHAHDCKILFVAEKTLTCMHKIHVIS